MGSKWGVFLVLGIFFISLISGITTQINNNPQQGITIDYPQFESVKLGTGFNLTINPMNTSGTNFLTGSAISCYLRIGNSSGESILARTQMTATNTGYHIFIPSANVTPYIGGFSFYIPCNGSSLSGFASGVYEVTKSGTILDLPESIIYSLLLISVFILFFISSYLLIITPYSNEVDSKGAVINITRKKYIKIGLIYLTYILFVWLLNILTGISDNYVTLTMYYGLISFLFLLMVKLSLPVAFGLLVLSFIEIIRDTNLQKNLNSLLGKR